MSNPPPSIPPNYAVVHVSNQADIDVRITGTSDACVECSPVTLVEQLLPNHGIDINIERSLPYELALQQHYENFIVCRDKFSLGEYGVYNWTLSRSLVNGSKVCEFVTVQEPSPPLGLVSGIFTFFFVMSAWVILTYTIQKLVKRKSTEGITNGSAFKDVETSPFQDPQRIESLDVFRGMSVILMVYVNVGGGMYHSFHHALWYGLTFADFPQPWFLWVVGFSIALSMRKKNANTNYRVWYIKIAKRFGLLFLWGTMLHSELFGINLHTFRFMGVLQKIAICYVVVALLQLHCCPELSLVTRRVSAGRAIREMLELTCVQWIVCSGLVIIHLCVTFLLDVPGCPKGYQGPGGKHKMSAFVDCAGGAAAVVDKMIVGVNHMVASYPFAVAYSHSSPFEPDGILGILTSIFQTFLGLQAGQYFLRFRRSTVLQVYLIYGLVSGALGLILSNGLDNNGWIPVCKMLWSLSFTMLTTSSAFLLLALCFYLVDVMKIWDGAPFVSPGMNSLLLLMAPIWTRKVIPFEWQVTTHGEHLVVDLWHTTVWVGITVYLHQKKVFWTV